MGRKLSLRVADVMVAEGHPFPAEDALVLHCIPPLAEMGSAAARRTEARGVMALPVVKEENQLVGVVHLHDLMRPGAV